MLYQDKRQSVIDFDLGYRVLDRINGPIGQFIRIGAAARDLFAEIAPIAGDGDAPASERIVGVALTLDKTLPPARLPAPKRHHDLIKRLSVLGVSEKRMTQATQGFITVSGEFLDRAQAREAAIRTGQAPDPAHARHLFSEDLW